MSLFTNEKTLVKSTTKMVTKHNNRILQVNTQGLNSFSLCALEWKLMHFSLIETSKSFKITLPCRRTIVAQKQFKKKKEISKLFWLRVSLLWILVLGIRLEQGYLGAGSLAHL